MRTTVALAVILGACGGSGAIQVTDAWAGSSPPSAGAAAIYLTIDNGTSAAVGVTSVVSDRCDTTEIHESTLDDQQVMRMRPATSERLLVGPGDTLEMRPGGLHVMCIGLDAPFDEGDEFGFVLELEDGSSISGDGVVENR